MGTGDGEEARGSRRSSTACFYHSPLVLFPVYPYVCVVVCCCVSAFPSVGVGGWKTGGETVRDWIGWLD